jgi:recombination protein RecR
MMIYPSKLIEEAVLEISKLPGIGKKSALRLVLHLLKREENQTFQLAEALTNMRTKTMFCKKCHNISDDDYCTICISPKRDHSQICIVEDTKDVLAIENTGQYRGLYHILNGIISPLEGISPNDLTIPSLLERIEDDDDIKEIIMALSPTMEGDTTAFYLQKKLKHKDNLIITTIARGIPIGGELEYIDEITLGRGISSRIKYE